MGEETGGVRLVLAGLTGSIGTSAGLTRNGGGRGFSFDRYNILGQGLKLRMDPDVFGSLYSKPHAVATDFENSDFDVVGNDDFLVTFPTDDKHRFPLALEAANKPNNTSKNIKTSQILS
jgi:hypothetical protein